ncbi:phage tail family protein [Paenibacillus tritici]|uniref:phage tail domain-containing protein n=1 Tax=Paenibacillus tritici TaxID=1873425 RepID=UPI001BAD4608|nr:phage tail domain-containing protein [Paenibacillus tritici]QUL57574.1 phage tail family protein [Paenibacillus tritici]
MIAATADGVAFESIGLGLKSHNIPVLPPTKDNTIELADRDGAVDFGSTYGPRIFNLDCIVMADDPTLDYQRRVALVAALFNIRKRDIVFTFGDLIGKRYVGRYAGTMDITKLIFDGEVSIPIKMNSPWPESTQDTTVREYGQGLEYGQGYLYSDYAVWIGSSGQNIVVRNEGSISAYPVLRISGAFSSFSLTDGVSTLVLSGTSSASDVWEINCDPGECTVRLNGQNAYFRSNGVFFELRPGNTTFTVSGGSLAFNLAFVFRYKYLY